MLVVLYRAECTLLRGSSHAGVWRVPATGVGPTRLQRALPLMRGSRSAKRSTAVFANSLVVDFVWWMRSRGAGERHSTTLCDGINPAPCKWTLPCTLFATLSSSAHPTVSKTIHIVRLLFVCPTCRRRG